MTFYEFNQKFPTDADAINYYIKIRYKNVLTCPHCKSNVNIYQFRKRPKIFQCNNCNNTFSAFKGTIFEKSRTDMRKWFYTIHLMLNGKKGISSLQLQRETGVTRKCAWRMLKQLRLDMGNVDNTDAFEFIVEADETYVGGNPKWRKFKKTENTEYKHVTKRGRGTNKTPIFGIKERSTGKVHAVIMPEDNNNHALTSRQIINVINKVCKKDTTVMTDQYRSYNSINSENNKNLHHFVINHSIGEYSKDGFIHTNGIENFWSLFKRGYYGIYHRISVKYLQSYINEFCFRMNNRKNVNIFDSLLDQAVIDEQNIKVA